ncbi:MAG: hypothetical protein IJA06_03735 [Oscillospiraceae bacterium]|nr:hypothetical protein [Oscillospiraceae bacterium]
MKTAYKKDASCRSVFFLHPPFFVLPQGTVLTVPFSLPRGEGGKTVGFDERGITK